MTRKRKFNTDKHGKKYKKSIIDAVWKHGNLIGGTADPPVTPNTFRKDCCGAIIDYRQYGKKTHNGWEIDHKKPTSLGGTDDISNLQPLHWKNNRFKSNHWPDWACKISSGPMSASVRKQNQKFFSKYIDLVNQIMSKKGPLKKKEKNNILEMVSNLIEEVEREG